MLAGQAVRHWRSPGLCVGSEVFFVLHGDLRVDTGESCSVHAEELVGLWVVASLQCNAVAALALARRRGLPPSAKATALAWSLGSTS